MLGPWEKELREPRISSTLPGDWSTEKTPFFGAGTVVTVILCKIYAK